MRLLQKRVLTSKQQRSIRMCTNRVCRSTLFSAPEQTYRQQRATELPLQFFFPLKQPGVISVWWFVRKQLPKIEAVVMTLLFFFCRELARDHDVCCYCWKVGGPLSADSNGNRQRLASELVTKQREEYRRDKQAPLTQPRFTTVYDFSQNFPYLSENEPLVMFGNVGVHSGR